MEAKSEAFEKDRQRLCQAGQRDAALQRARQFGLEMSVDPLLKQIKGCTAGLTLPQQRYNISLNNSTPPVSARLELSATGWQKSILRAFTWMKPKDRNSMGKMRKKSLTSRP